MSRGWTVGGTAWASVLRRTLVALVIAAVGVVAWASVASAHVSLVSSEPQNISTVVGPLNEVRLTFSAEADAVEEKFGLVTADGSQLAIESISNHGPEVLVVRLASAAPTGRTRLTWAIRSGDSHTMTGSVSFTVTDAPAVGAAAGEPVEGSGDASAVDAAPVASAVDAAGSAPERTLADHLATVARWLVYGAAFMCIGGLAYLGFVHRGTPEECRRLVFYVRRSAVVVVIATVVEWLAQVVAYSQGTIWTVVSPSAWADLLGTGFAKGTALRLIGAGLVLGFTRTEVDRWNPDRVDVDPLDPFSSERVRSGSRITAVLEADRVLARSRVEASATAFVGAILLIASEAFIGHTATVSPRVAVLMSDAAHMAAAAAWASGALMLALTLRARRRSGQPLDARLLAVRFSVMATWALVVVAISGVVLAWSIFDGVSALWSSEFGRLLLVKLTLVAGLVAAGAYNHLVLVPGLEAEDPVAEGRFATAITVEAVLFGAVLAATALLVVSSPT